MNDGCLLNFIINILVNAEDQWGCAFTVTLAATLRGSGVTIPRKVITQLLIPTSATHVHNSPVYKYYAVLAEQPDRMMSSADEKTGPA